MSRLTRFHAVQMTERFCQKRKIENEDIIQELYLTCLEQFKYESNISYQKLHSKLTRRYNELMDIISFRESNIIPTEDIILLIDMDDRVLFEELHDNLSGVVNTLRENEMEVINLRYGFIDKARTLEECGDILGISRERVRQIEAIALRKMRHPARSRNFKHFLDYYL